MLKVGKTNNESPTMLSIAIAFILGGSAGFVLGCAWVSLFARRDRPDLLAQDS